MSLLALGLLSIHFLFYFSHPYVPHNFMNREMMGWASECPASILHKVGKRLNAD
jgi:hypothetical protein